MTTQQGTGQTVASAQGRPYLLSNTSSITSPDVKFTSSSFGTHIDQFRSAIGACGLSAPDNITDDGTLRRFSTNGKPRDTSGWYILHGDAIPSGAFGCWRSGLQSTWSAERATELTANECQEMRVRTNAMMRQRDEEQAQLQTAARMTAAARLTHSTPAVDHPYLTTKGILAHGVKLQGEALLIPLYDTERTLHSLQSIKPDGSKRFLTGGRVTGCYFGIGTPKGLVIVCEGFATGASLYECTGHAVAVAFNAGNLDAVAIELRKKYPTLPIVIAADDDHLTAGNPGLTKATVAARAVQGSIAVPVFATNRNDGATDFNDMHRSVGAEAVRLAIARASVPDNTLAQLDRAAEIAAQNWPEPTPLPNALPPVQPFDPDLMPLALRAWVMDIAHRMQCPPDFAAVGAVVGVSSLIGARAVIQPKEHDEWQVVSNLWGLLVGRPGVMKSPALGEVLKPISHLQRTEVEQWKTAHDAWFLDAKLAELQTADNEKKAKGLASKDPAAARALLEPLGTPSEPEARRYIVNDATVEKLGELLQVNPWGVLVYRDEIYGLLTSMDKQGQEGARSFYLQSYDGNQGYTFDRIGRGTVHIPRVCLAMIGGIQPGRLQEYVRGAVSGGAADDGLLQRFGLTIWPDTHGVFQHVDQHPDTNAKEAAYAVFERISAIQPASETEPNVWKFDAAAQALYVEWRKESEQELKSGNLHPALESHFSKFRKLIPALALIFAVVDTPDNGYVVGKAELMRAFAWGDYLRSHAVRVYSAATTPEVTGAASLLKKIMGGSLGAEFTPRFVAQKGWAGLNTPDLVRKAADVLETFDWLRYEVQKTAGRPSERYVVNPLALTGGAA
ncbi:DUF3987 domain-containing protein [Massilia sp. TWR1-2-2]|uniref:DUF3987 domain-containing protein n=1 Tax=Massilia sp. TWR1-2-2 TaxID=2804584 RepID=UPI003CEEB992